ncbi:MAG: EamA family transporter [Propionibacteriaceae bacterium]|nr:EamA family transporter [Micropruina sp.]
MWIAYAFGSAFFAGITAVLAKMGIKNTASNTVTAVRTVIVAIFAWIMVFVVGSQGGLASLDARSVTFLILSGLATGASWLCYFKALQLGDVTKVVPVDRSSIVLTVLLAIIVLGETQNLLAKLVGITLIAIGTWLMIDRKPDAAKAPLKGSWLMYAIGSAVFAALTAILGKVGITGVESNLGTAIRTLVVLVMAWVVVGVTGERGQVRNIPRRDIVYIALSGVTTGASWLCYYRALQEGPTSVVVPIDKASILVTVGIAYFFLGERLSKRATFGLVILLAGTGVMLV